MLPGVFQSTPLSGRSILHPSSFIRPIHPKAEIRPTPEAIRKVLEAGWLGQLKIHGHRAQIHISSNPNQEILIFNRQGQLHKKKASALLLSELRRLFLPSKDWNVIDAEWVKGHAQVDSKQNGKSDGKYNSQCNDKLYVFDFLKLEGELLRRLKFLDRWKLLPRAYISPILQTLPVLTTVEQCLQALQRPEEMIEGLVFKSSSPGFEDSSIVRCRR